MAPRCCRAQPARMSASRTMGLAASRCSAKSSALNRAFLMKPPESSYLTPMASQSTSSAQANLPRRTNVAQMVLRCCAVGGAYSITVEMRRCMASSSSAGRLVARKTRPAWRSISWSMARRRRSEPPPASRDRNKASHSSKKSTASLISASRNKPRRSASTSSFCDPCLPLKEAKSTCKTRLPSLRATPCTVIVLPVPEGPQSSTMRPAPYGKAFSNSPVFSAYGASLSKASQSCISLALARFGSTTSSRSTFGEYNSEPSTSSLISVSSPTTKSKTRRSSSTRCSVKSDDPLECHRDRATRTTPRAMRRAPL
mmetsp:Transcript_32740/g.110273  ORF Transcript_32740/g.110273 Transcript_32740/m.110273 type:complete len:313 (-) Transcript_32740:1582-2520(-)